MKKWKIINIVTAVILFIFIMVVIGIGIDSYMYEGTYPYPALGTDISNWQDAFLLKLGLASYVLAVPFIINCCLLIISIIKIKNQKKK